MCQHDRGVITCRFLSTPARIVSTSSKLWSSAATKRNAPSAGARNSSPGFQCLRFLPRGRRLLPLLREHVAVAAIRAVPVPVPCPIWTNSTVGGLRRLEWQSRKCFTPQRKHCDFRDQNRVTGVTLFVAQIPILSLQSSRVQSHYGSTLQVASGRHSAGPNLGTG